MRIIYFIFIGTIAFTLSSCNSNKTSDQKATIDSSESWSLVGFAKVDSMNPVMGPGNNSFIDPVGSKKVFWEKKDVFNPAVVVRNDTLFMLYRAQDSMGTSRIGLAWSIDGFHFTRNNAPVLFPGNDSLKKYEWPGGCEDPRVVEGPAGTYFMNYTAYDGKVARLFVASSTDLLHWKKYGSAFGEAYNGKYKSLWSKSGAVVAKYSEGKVVAEKIGGKYWMYWGDQNIWCANSDDLIHWVPLEMEGGEKSLITLKGQALNMPKLKIVIPTREKKFDCDLVESGPPAMITDSGILLIYNSRNIPSMGDSSLPEGTYTAGEALMDKNNPSQMVHRLDNYFMKPDKPYEMRGQVNNVCFLEGLVQFHHKWFLYYGTADSKIALAVRGL